MAIKPLERFCDLANAARNAAGGGNDGKTIIQVGNATCENAAGSRAVLLEFRKHLEASGRRDIELREVGCTGRCSCEPIVGILTPGRALIKYESVDLEKAHRIFTSHVLDGQPVDDLILDDQPQYRSRHEIYVCGAPRCSEQEETSLFERFRAKLVQRDIPGEEAKVLRANCMGLCDMQGGTVGTHILILPARIVYRARHEADLDRIIDTHIVGGKIVEDLRVQQEPLSQRFFEQYGDQSFFNQQTRLAMRNAGIINPESIDAYLTVDGFAALAKVLNGADPNQVIETMLASKLRGRGGGGYPTGTKWQNCAREQNETKYIICNADEGDPGAFMDRSMLESDPFSVIEGMLIGGYAIGASQGYFYVRAEYPLAIKRLEKAIAQMHERGFLGKDILGSGFNFDVEIRLGAGAFVCGEETALIHSIEGQRGEPRIRPPYPSTSGLFGKPTVINNVETFANVPVVILYGASWFSRLGTPGSGGTKVFALAGKVRHTGLIEVPMGTTLRQIVFEIGGGIEGGKRIKAIQTGGPAGGCLPAKWLDTPVDFDTLAKAGSIMGSGGMIVMDEDDCMVDIARYFLSFSQDESCGKCTPCREGSTRMLEILQRITEGKGVPEDLVKLKRLGNLMKKASLCGLGRAASNPVLSTITHFLDEYEAHIVHKKCPAHKCVALIHYEIDAEACTGCTACARKCPVSCISGERKKPHVIDQSLCIKCGQCFNVCRFDAVKRM